MTISTAYLEKCIKDPKEAELWAKNLAHIPASEHMMTAFWNAQGARVVNDELIFDENGKCCGSPNTYVTNNRASSGGHVQDKNWEEAFCQRSETREDSSNGMKPILCN